jgi:hypothetical protein
MKHLLGSVAVLTVSVSTAFADPFQGLAAHGHAQFGVTVSGTRDNASDGGSEDKYGDTSFYAGVGGSASISSTWEYEYQEYVGDDDQGNPIYQTYYETQYESGSAQAYAYGRFDRGGDAISAEVYAYSLTDSSYSGSQAYCSADAFAYGSIDITFSLASWTSVQLFSSTYYDNGNITLYRDGDFVLDTSNLYGLGTVKTALAPGNYQLIGESFYGGADFSIQAVPEPASLAALGLGVLAVRRRYGSRRQP